MDAWLQLVLYGAFTAGLLGGVHCAAMCGGIIGVVSLPAGSGASRWRLALSYNAGRLSSYATAGALAGALGQAGVAVRGGPALQTFAWWIASATLILLACHVAGFTPVTRAMESAGSVIWRRVQPLSRRFLPVTTARSAVGLGLVWGWLPCGMVYAVLFTSAASADPVAGAAIMLAFGAGTLPNVLGIALVTGTVRGLLGRRGVRYAAAAAIAAVGIYGLLHAHQAGIGADGLACTAAAGIGGAWW